MRYVVACLLFAALSSAARAQIPADSGHADLYTVAAYDPARNPEADLAATIERAQAEGKRILLEIGGDWCTWCHALDRYLRENETVSDLLARSFLVMKVNYSEENRNEAFLSRFPKRKGYPHFFVLDTDGTFLHSQGTGPLDEGKSYSRPAFLAFLAQWAPARAE